MGTRERTRKLRVAATAGVSAMRSCSDEGEEIRAVEGVGRGVVLFG